MKKQPTIESHHDSKAQELLEVDTERRHMEGARALVIVHFALALLLPFIFSQIGGCQPEDGILPVDFGPPVAESIVDQALNASTGNMDPMAIEVGQFVLITDTQELAAGASRAITADTGQTIIDRQESSTEVLLTLIQHRQTYENGEVRKVSTEIPLRIDKTAATGSDSKLMIGPNEDQVVSNSYHFRPEIDRMLRDRSPRALTDWLRRTFDNSTSASVSTGELIPQDLQPHTSLQTQATRITYHRLQQRVATEAPPLAVQQAAQCGGLPQCQMQVHHVSFDMVFWENDVPDRLHWTFAFSPDAPYLASTLNRCVEGLASVGTGQAKLLVKQCSTVMNFKHR